MSPLCVNSFISSATVAVKNARLSPGWWPLDSLYTVASNLLYKDHVGNLQDLKWTATLCSQGGTCVCAPHCLCKLFTHISIYQADNEPVASWRTSISVFGGWWFDSWSTCWNQITSFPYLKSVSGFPLHLGKRWRFFTTASNLRWPLTSFGPAIPWLPWCASGSLIP